MRHPWDDRHPLPLMGSRTHAEPPSRWERIWMALLVITMILVCGLDGGPT